MQQEINNLIRARLAEYADEKGIDVAYANHSMSPKSEIYLDLHIMPGTTLSMDLASKLRTYKGIVQININTQAGRGERDVLAIANELINLFDLDTKLTSEQITLYVSSVPSLLNSITSNSIYTQPISFSYRVDTS